MKWGAKEKEKEKERESDVKIRMERGDDKHSNRG